VDELQAIKPKKVLYIQVDSQAKYLSEDWFLNDRFDTFAIYTLFKAAAHKNMMEGYMTTYLSNYDELFVDLKTDFPYFYSLSRGFLHVVYARCVITCRVLWDIFTVITLVFTIHQNFLAALG